MISKFMGKQVNETLISIFKELEDIDFEINKLNNEIHKYVSIFESPEESKDPRVIELMKLKDLRLDKYNVLTEEAKTLVNTESMTISLKSDYFINNFSNIQERLDFINSKLEDEIILDGTRELFTSLAYSSTVSSYSPINIYYVAYKFPKIFHQEVNIIDDQVLDIKDPVDCKEVTHDLAISIIDNRKPIGKFYEIDGDKHIGIDNTIGEALVEVFDTKEKCLDWLNGKELEDDWEIER